MLQQLLDTVASHEFEELGGWLRLQSVGFADRSVSFDIEVHVGDFQSGHWRLTCEESVDYRFSHGCIADLELKSEHPVLWRFIKRQREIYFRGTVDSPHALIGAIAEAHAELVGNWLPLGTFLNPLVPIPELLAGGHGLFATGPEPLLDSYQSVLTASGLAVSGPSPRAPKYWNGRQWITDTTNWRALILGDSYIVGRAFEAQRVG